MNDGSPVRPLPCPDCDHGQVVDYDRHDRGLSSGAPQACSTCHGSGHARCFWRISEQCSVVADRTLEGEPACAACWATARLDVAADEIARERGLTVACSEAAQ